MKRSRKQRALAAIISGVMVVVAGLAMTQSAVATTADTLYSYNFVGVSTSPVANDATTNAGVDLSLEGDWSPSATGVHFAGDLVSQQSVGQANPATGDTINVAGSNSVGVTIKFKFEAPTGGSWDSTNLTQIGRSGAGLSQIKIQTSNSSAAPGAVYPECRMAGAGSTTSDAPQRGSTALVDGGTYIVSCWKAPDQGNAKALQYMRTIRVDAPGGNAQPEIFPITGTGTIQSTAYLSVANKYALDPIAQNTDQFNGDVARVAYCTAATTAAVIACIDAETPQPPAPTTTEYVTNQSVESGMTEWSGVQGTPTNVRVQPGYDDSCSSSSWAIKSTNAAGSAASTGFSSNPRVIDGTTQATVAGRVYSGSLYAKSETGGPSQVAIYLRERPPGSSTTIGSNTVYTTVYPDKWTKISNDYTAIASGNSLTFYVFATMNPGASFYADQFSLTATF